MDLTFQVPIQYCSLQHRTLVLSPVTSTTGYYFCFGSIPSFFLELFLHWSPVAYWAPTNLGSSTFSVLFFCLFILFMEFSRQEYWSGLSFPSPVDLILSDLSSMTCPSWVAPQGIWSLKVDLWSDIIVKLLPLSSLFPLVSWKHSFTLMPKNTQFIAACWECHLSKSIAEADYIECFVFPFEFLRDGSDKTQEKG